MSDAELELLKKVNPDWHTLVTESTVGFNPVSVWKDVALILFATNAQGPDVDCVRAVMTALSRHNPYRSTSEFDALCKGAPHES